MPLLQVGWQGSVQVDGAFRAQLNTAGDHQKTVGETTWKAVNHFAQTLKENKIRIAFFSATPQGGGVALMRHALVRFSNILGVDLKWYGEYQNLQFQFSSLIQLTELQCPNPDQECSEAPRTCTTSYRALPSPSSVFPTMRRIRSGIGFRTTQSDTGSPRVDRYVLPQKEEPIS